MNKRDNWKENGHEFSKVGERYEATDSANATKAKQNKQTKKKKDNRMNAKQSTHRPIIVRLLEAKDDWKFKKQTEVKDLMKGAT